MSGKLLERKGLNIKPAMIHTNICMLFVRWLSESVIPLLDLTEA